MECQQNSSFEHRGTSQMTRREINSNGLPPCAPLKMLSTDGSAPVAERTIQMTWRKQTSNGFASAAASFSLALAVLWMIVLRLLALIARFLCLSSGTRTDRLSEERSLTEEELNAAINESFTAESESLSGPAQSL